MRTYADFEQGLPKETFLSKASPSKRLWNGQMSLEVKLKQFQCEEKIVYAATAILNLSFYPKHHD